MIRPTGVQYCGRDSDGRKLNYFDITKANFAILANPHEPYNMLAAADPSYSLGLLGGYPSVPVTLNDGQFFPLGPDETQRVGRRVRWHSIVITCQFYSPYTQDPAADVYDAEAIRYVLVYDRYPPQDASYGYYPSWGDVFQDQRAGQTPPGPSGTDVYSQPNLSNSDRFLICWDKWIFTPDPVITFTSAIPPVPQVADGYSNSSLVDYHRKMSGVYTIPLDDLHSQYWDYPGGRQCTHGRFYLMQQGTCLWNPLTAAIWTTVEASFKFRMFYYPEN